MSEKLSIDDEPHELKLGKSFDSDGTLSFHSLCYDFKPASIDPAQPAVIDIENGNKVKVTVPHVEGSSMKQTVYCGSKQPSQKDFALIINHKTGEFMLERLACRLNLKRSRSEKAREVRPTAKPASETSKPTNDASVTVTTATPTVKQEPAANTSKNAKRKSSAASSHGREAKKSTSKSDLKQKLSGSSSSEVTSSDDDQPSTASESDDDKPLPGVSGRGTQRTSKSASSTTFNICEDLQLSESGSSSESD